MATMLFTSLEMDNGENLWDSLESDTESLAQEKQRRKFQNDRIQGLDVEENLICTQQAGDGGDGEEEDEDDDYIYDSLDMAVRKDNNAAIHQVQQTEGGNERQNNLKDEYADLRYDPNWRTNFGGAEFFEEGNQHFLLGKESHLGEVSEGEPWEMRKSVRTVEKKGMSISGRVPIVAFKTEKAGESLSAKSKIPTTPYHLLEQQCLGTQPKLLSPGHQWFSETLDQEISDCNSGSWYLVKNQKPSDAEQVYFSKPHVTVENSNEGRPGRYESCKQNCTQTSERTKMMRNGILPNLKHSQQSSTMKEPAAKQDIVEKNKRTLGVSAAQQGSYLWTHKQRGGKGYDKQKVSEPAEDVSSIASQGSRGNVIDAEHRWQQQAQELKCFNNKNVLKSERQAHSGRPEKVGVLRPPAVGDRQNVHDGPESSGPGHIPTTREHSQGHAEVLVIDDGDSSSMSGVSWLSTPPVDRRIPSINRNVGLKVPADVMPFLNHGPPQAGTGPFIPWGPTWAPPWADGPGIYHLHLVNARFADQPSSPQMVPHYTPKLLAHSSRATLPPPAPTLDRASVQHRLGRHFPHQDSGGTEHCGTVLFVNQDASAAKKTDLSRARILPTKQSVTQESRQDDPGDQYTTLQYERNCGPNTRHTPADTGPYLVLPPIGQPAGGDSEHFNTIRRSSSEGYLAQMEKQKKLKERMGYKAYTLKDYKSLQKDINLGGLGPNYKLAEITVEKMQRQRLYSNAVREQNREMSRNLALLAKPSVGRENKDLLPRRKPKKREFPMKENFTEHAQYLEDLDISQLVALEMLQKRHEEEKKAVALFRALPTM
ncbi:jhy protein homolog isoform X2 [Paramormyrops kingsleyae]|uniref:jhy protein homolog isoform X2 n=1 Tax=Paramormyrops kingsleyae TaxID=1676925 RepID=UPI000CD5E125|nr:jhy protein homolog isoform X2 [Paramormyrops kingsleyae]